MNQNKYFRFYFIIAFGILNIISLMLLFSALTFIFNFSLSWWHFPLSIFSSIAINYFASKYYFEAEFKSVFYKTSLILLILLVLSVLFGLYIYDISWDGQAYHQEMIIQLKEGWNPFYSQLPSSTIHSIWLNHYGKGAEIPQSAIYAFLNKIEAGKATNILLMLTSYLLCVYMLSKINELSALKIYIISFLFALNPVAINNMFTYYVDGQVASLLSCLFLVCCMLYVEEDKYKYILFSAIILITVNIKFTSVVFTILFILGLIIALIYKKNIIKLKKVLISASLSLIIGICLVGYNPYVTNTINNGNPFYPILGKDKIDIMLYNSPKGFPGKNRFEKLAISLFSRPDDILEETKRSPVIKIPFVIKKGDIHNSVGHDVRISGFGFLFEEIILLSVGILCSILFLGLAEYRRCLLYIICVLLFSIFIISEAWWARYVPQLWFVPLIILIGSELIQHEFLKYIRTAMYILLLINSVFIMALCIKSNIHESVRIVSQLNQLKSTNKNVIVFFGPFRSIRERLSEHNIKYTENNISGDKNVVNIEGSYGRATIKLEDIAEDEPKSIIVR